METECHKILDEIMVWHLFKAKTLPGLVLIEIPDTTWYINHSKLMAVIHHAWYNSFSINHSQVNTMVVDGLGPLLTTWFDLNSSMDK